MRTYQAAVAGGLFAGLVTTAIMVAAAKAAC